MKVNLVGVLFVLDSEKNDNIRKNDVKSLKVLVSDEGFLPSVIYSCKDMKEDIRESIFDKVNSKFFHLEQVFTFGYSNRVDVIYLGVMNIDKVSLSEGYSLKSVDVLNNNVICFGEDEFNYKTIEREVNNSIEYFHEVDVNDEDKKRLLLYILICYKRVRSNIDNTDILFKFLGDSFTLEDVRMVYELVKDVSVDKSNFRKKIVKYCEKIEEGSKSGNGFRPSQRYKFKPLKGDVWL